jgi:hypothetical protein
MRRRTGPLKPRQVRTKTFDGPIGGWISNQSLSNPDPRQPQGAYRLDNIFPTATGGEVRGGSEKHATLGSTTGYVKSFLTYRNGSVAKLFGAIDAGIYEITTPADPDVSPSASVSGTTNGEWFSTQFATTGGVYLVAVNGEDDLRVYDGNIWFPIAADDLDLLYYENGTADFSVGETVTGGTSSATGEIVALFGTTDNGYLILKDVTGGPYTTSEAITSAGGSAEAREAETTIVNGISEVDTSDLSYIWTYKNRIFAVEKDTQNAWYLTVDALGGTATKFPLGGVFPSGGSLLFGASWSLDSSGSGGLSAQCIFVSTEGEVAVYQGNDPGSASAWSLVGVYKIGKPLGPDAWFRAGGDLVIATDIGLMPLSQAINRDIAALAPAAVSFPIEVAWNDAVDLRSSANWTCAVWPERQMAITALPTVSGTSAEMFVANVRTGRWCRFTGWDARCVVAFEGRFFFGSTDGTVIEGYVTGLDQNSTFTAVYIPLFEELGDGASLKIPKNIRATLRSTINVDAKLSMQFDYVVSLPPAPSSAAVETGDVWGTGTWGPGGSVWGSGREKSVYQPWASVGGAGYALAPSLQVTSGSIRVMDAEIIKIAMTYEMAEIIT